MNKEEAIEQLYRLSLDWEEDGAFTKLNQTDINAIKIIVDELDISNKKLEEINSVVRKIEDSPYLYWDNVQRILLSIIGGE